MEFSSVNGIKRPVRLSEATRNFAYESLGHKYGLMTKENMSVSLDEIEGFESFTPIQKYDAAIMKIASEAPVRICDGELISGAATLGLAISHLVPATYGGNHVFWSNSHLTVDFETVLKTGIKGIRKNAEAAYEKYKGTDREEFAKSCLNCLDAFDIWHKRYLEALKDKGYTDNYNNLLNVPQNPPKSFYEAVQSIWFTFAFIRLCGNWPGIGRIDKLLMPFYKADVEKGILTKERAREILAHFFIKGCEWICGGNYGSGDAQHYQNLVLSGVDEDGVDITNDVTYLVLDIIEELGISDFPTTVRLSKQSDEKLIRRVAEVMRLGGGVLAVYDEDNVIKAMTEYGYDLCEARRFANDGCWEVQVLGKTNFCYIPTDFLQILQKQTLKSYDKSVIFDSFESLYSAYLADVKAFCEGLLSSVLQNNMLKCENGQWLWRKNMPCTVVSLFEQDCVGRGLSYLEGGAVYNVISPHVGGLADTVNSLYAIKKLVFDDKKTDFTSLMQILSENWENDEALRQYALNKYEYYGNDNDESDEICRRFLSDFADICDSLNGRSGYIFPGGVSTFGRQLEWSPQRLACASGRKKGEVLAANASPTPGTDRQGATALIRSYCKNELHKLPVGAALDIRLLPSCTAGDEGLDVLAALLRGFVNLGGFFMQPDVADAEILKEAQKKPEEYQNLSVRVSGWNARFVTLNKEWQDMVIEQNECGCRY